MQQFALATVRPRSIAWLVRSDEWERLEIIVKYNSVMLGGYYNVLIPLTREDKLTEEYERFLRDYDPDFVVLAPNMQPFVFRNVYPFGFISWNEVGRIVTLDPLGYTKEVGVTTQTSWLKVLANARSFSAMLLAVADPAKPDASKRALIACGDAERREPDFDIIDNNIQADAKGYLETFLLHFLKPEYDQRSILPYTENGEVVFPDISRSALKNVIKEENSFPLSGVSGILNKCLKMQHFPEYYSSFIGLTANYATRGTPPRKNYAAYPVMAILISDQFGVEEAALFWNLRAASIYVAWLSFSEVENDLLELAHWLESSPINSFSMASGIIGADGFPVALSSSEENGERLRKLVNQLKDIIQNGVSTKMLQSYSFISLQAVLFKELISYDYTRPSVSQDYYPLVSVNEKLSFLPKLPQEYSTGFYSLLLDWRNVMLPQSINTLGLWQSLPERKESLSFVDLERPESRQLSYCRIDSNHSFVFQIETEQPVEIDVLSPYQVVSSLFKKAGFSRIEPSSSANFQTTFVERSGTLAHAASYLIDHPYKILLEILARDQKDRNEIGNIGWFLTHPSGRYALNHFDLWRLFKEPYPPKNNDYYLNLTTYEYYRKLSDKLPAEVALLLKQRVLERGFLMKCDLCFFNSWYPAEHVGQEFTCARCFQTQIYASNPLWLYKLPEIIFQGFIAHMEVPLLALYYMERRHKHYFQWMPDTDVFWRDESEEKKRNIDIICICDGKVYIGEAKSNGEIERDQFLFYQRVCQEVAVDGVIFATTQEKWSRKTYTYIDSLKKNFSGDVIVLTKDDLYQAK